MKTIINLLIALILPSLIFAQYYENHEYNELSDSILIFHGMPDYQPVLECYENGKDTLWYEDGSVMAIGLCIDNQKAGMWESYYKNGNLRTKGIIKDGHLYGKWEFFYENGQKRAEGTFVYEHVDFPCGGGFMGNAMEGKWQYWNEEGVLVEEVHFINDYPNSFYKSYYSDGTLKCEGLYYGGEKNGLWTYYYESGNKERTEFYRYGYDEDDYETAIPYGYWTYYDEAGNVLKVEDFVSR